MQKFWKSVKFWLSYNIKEFQGGNFLRHSVEWLKVIRFKCDLRQKLTISSDNVTINIVESVQMCTMLAEKAACRLLHLMTFYYVQSRAKRYSFFVHIYPFLFICLCYL